MGSRSAKNALQIVEDQDNPNQRLFEISKNAIMILCYVCTAKTNRFYIPGETSISERLRKNSFDFGTYTMLHWIVKSLKDKPEMQEIKHYIREKVLNWIELGDLQYHAKVLKLICDNPTANQDEPQVTTVQHEEEQKEPASKKGSGQENIWQEPPQLRFPSCLVKVLDLQQMLQFVQERIEVVKDRIEKRKQEDNAKRLEKQQQYLRQQESLLEQKKKRYEEINRKKDFQMKMGIGVYQQQPKQPALNNMLIHQQAPVLLQVKTGPQTNLLQNKKAVLKSQTPTNQLETPQSKYQTTPASQKSNSNSQSIISAEGEKTTITTADAAGDKKEESELPTTPADLTAAQ